MFTSAEIAHEASLLRDLREGPAADMLSYCAAILAKQERAMLCRSHIEITNIDRSTVDWTVEHAERKAIKLALEETNGNKSRAALMLGIGLKTLHNKLRRMRKDGIEI